MFLFNTKVDNKGGEFLDSELLKIILYAFEFKTQKYELRFCVDLQHIGGVDFVPRTLKLRSAKKNVLKFILYLLNIVKEH